jgi:hypothetical protein
VRRVNQALFEDGLEDAIAVGAIVSISSFDFKLLEMVFSKSKKNLTSNVTLPGKF